MYPYIHDAVIYKTKEGTQIFLVTQGRTVPVTRNVETTLSFCDGLHKEKDVIDTIVHHMGVSQQEAEESYKKIRKTFSDIGILHYRNTPQAHPVVYRPRVLNPPFEKTYLDLTHQYNPSCTHSHNTPDKDELSVDEWKDAIDELFDCGCLKLSLTGADSLLYNGFFEIIRYARKKPVAVSVLINDGLEREPARRMKKVGVCSVHFSVDGPTAAIHDKFRGVTGSFDKTVAAIKTAKSEQLQIRVTTCIHRGNLNKGGTLVNLMNTLGVTEYTVAPVNQPFCKSSTAITSAEYTAFVESLPRTNTIPVIAQPYIRNCRIGYTECVIHRDGTVGLCTPFNIHTPPLGDLTTDTFVDVWNSPFLQKLRRTSTFYEPCKSPHACSWSGRCIARTYYMTEIISCGNLYTCARWKSIP
jgi:MoaA/NifB/PqqE/SkfB family radical SAM enzyme